MTNIGVPIIEHGLLAMSETEWDLAVRTAALIGPLARRDVVGRRAAADAAAQLGVSLRQVYVLIERFRRGSGNVTDLLPGQSDGGRDTGRLAEPVEDVVQELIRTLLETAEAFPGGSPPRHRPGLFRQGTGRTVPEHSWPPDSSSASSRRFASGEGSPSGRAMRQRAPPEPRHLSPKVIPSKTGRRKFTLSRDGPSL